MEKISQNGISLKNLKELCKRKFENCHCQYHNDDFLGSFECTDGFSLVWLVVRSVLAQKEVMVSCFIRFWSSSQEFLVKMHSGV